MSGGGTNTVQSNSQPPPAFENALTDVGNSAARTASTPFTPYPGQLQAGLSPDQLAAFQTIQGAQGITAPYINAAAQEIGNSTTPLAPTIKPFVDNATGLFNQVGDTNLSGTVQPGVANANGLFSSSANVTPQEIAQFQNPFTSSVVNATQAEFANQNEQQQAGISGNAISQGAFGGDREAVAHGITAGQEQLAQAPVIAGLNSQAYAQALQEANTQNQLRQGAGQGILAGSGQLLSAGQAQGQLKLGAGQGITGLSGQVLGANEANAWLDSQAGFGLGNLGNEALGNTLTEANAQLGIGGIEQQQAQQALNIPYEQYIQAQAYPFQTNAWAAGIAGELANAAGGTASTTSPGPSPISQIAGLGTTGLALNQLGAFNGLGSAIGGGGGTAAGLAAASSFVPDAAALEAASAAGSAGIASGAGEAFGLLAAAKRGGAIPHRAGGGGIAAFPLHRARMPGAAGRGLFSNDNMMPTPPRRLAAGGVAIPQLPTGGGPSITGGNGVAIPQLAASGGGRGLTAAASGPSAVSDYLTKQAAGASHAPPPVFVPPPAPPPPPGPTPQEIAFQAQNDINEGNILNGQPGGMRHGGGLMARRAGGGGLDMNLDAEPPPTYGMPGGGSYAGPAPEDEDLPVPPVPPRPAGQAHTGGKGLGAAMPEPPTPPDQQGGTGLAGGRPRPAPIPGADDSGEPVKASPWMALLAAGMGMMGGTSPHALTNIGKGGLEGLQFGEQMRVREEQAALRRLQQQDLAAYRQGQLVNTANRNDTYAQRVMEQTSTDQARAALMMARASVVGASHATEGDILGQAVSSLADGKTVNPDTGAPWTRAEALMHVRGVDARNEQAGRRLDQGDRRLDQADDRIAQGAQRIAAGEDAQKARLAAQQRGQDMTATNAQIHAAATMVASGSVPDFKTAYARVTGAAGGAPAQVGGGGGAQLADPLGIR